MKNRILILMLFVASYSFSQSVNDYKAVVIPLKYSFQKSENQFRLQTLTKMNLKKAGFEAFYANESLLADFQDRCSLLYLDMEKDNGFLTTKVFVTLKDCYGSIIFKSPIGMSREKEYETAYVEAANIAFESVQELNYKYNGNTNFSSKTGSVAQSMPVAVTPSAVVPAVSTNAAVAVVPIVAPPKTPKNESKSSSTSTSLLYAQPTSYGYQLIDGEPKVVMKLYKTSNANSFMAKKGEIQGALVAKDNQWFFEYYQGDNLISEKVEVKF